MVGLQFNHNKSTWIISLAAHRFNNQDSLVYNNWLNRILLKHRWWAILSNRYTISSNSSLIIGSLTRKSHKWTLNNRWNKHFNYNSPSMMTLLICVTTSIICKFQTLIWIARSIGTCRIHYPRPKTLCRRLIIKLHSKAHFVLIHPAQNFFSNVKIILCQ